MNLNHRTFERCRRLVSMSWDELRVRTGQEIAKRWDLIHYCAGGEFGTTGCDSWSRSSARYHWQEQNPYPIGINWASSLEVAFRSLSWLWIANLLNGCDIAAERFSTDLRRALMLNAHHIERFLSTYFSPNTHLLGEGVGLFS